MGENLSAIPGQVGEAATQQCFAEGHSAMAECGFCSPEAFLWPEPRARRHARGGSIRSQVAGGDVCCFERQNANLRKSIPADANQPLQEFGVHVSMTYVEPKGGFGIHSALSLPNFFPKFSAGSAPLAVEEQANLSPSKYPLGAGDLPFGLD